MNSSESVSGSYWQIPARQANDLLIDQTQFPELTSNTSNEQILPKEQFKKKLQTSSKVRRGSSYASLFKHDNKPNANDGGIIGKNSTLHTTNQANNGTVVTGTSIAPAKFYQNVPPPHLATQPPMYASLPLVAAAAEVTTPCGEKIYIPLDGNKYELKRNGDNSDEHPQPLGAYVFQKESEMDGYEHSPRPVRYRGSSSDEDASESDGNASKSSSSTSTTHFDYQQEAASGFSHVYDFSTGNIMVVGKLSVEENILVKTMTDEPLVTNAYCLKELSTNGNASGENEATEVRHGDSVTEPKHSTESENIAPDAKVVTDVSEATLADIPQDMYYAQMQQPQIPQYTQDIDNAMVYYQNWEYAQAPDNIAPTLYSQYQPTDIQYGAATYDQYVYTQYSAYPEAVGYGANPADYMTGYSAVAWSVPQMESPLQEAYHLNGESCEQQEYVDPESGSVIKIEEQDQHNQQTTQSPNTVQTDTPAEILPEFPAEIPPENHTEQQPDLPPGIHTGLPAEISTDASIPKDPPLYPALHVSDDGLVTVILRHGIFLEMTVDRDLRLVCHDRKLVAAMNNDGTCACLIHPAAKVHQKATTVDVELYLARKVKIMTENIVFGNNFSNYVFDYNTIEKYPDFPNYLDQSDDRSVGFLNTDTGFFNLDTTLRTSEIVRRAYFEVYQTNGSKVIVNGVKIVQTDHGDVTVYSGPIKYLRLSPMKNILRLRSQFLEADIETNWNVKLKRGGHTLNASYLGLILSNGNIKACLDQNNKLQAFELPDHKRMALGQRLQKKRLGVPPPDSAYINVTEWKAEPEGDHWGYPVQHGV